MKIITKGLIHFHSYEYEYKDKYDHLCFEAKFICNGDGSLFMIYADLFSDYFMTMSDDPIDLGISILSFENIDSLITFINIDDQKLFEENKDKLIEDIKKQFELRFV